MHTFRAISIAAGVAMVAGLASAEELRFGYQVETPSVDPHWSTNTSAIAIGKHAFDHLIHKNDSITSSTRTRRWDSRHNSPNPGSRLTT